MASESPQSPGRAVLSAVIVGTIVLALVLTATISSLAWPIGQELASSRSSSNGNSISGGLGLLYLHATSQRTAAGGCASCPAVVEGSEPLGTVFPLAFLPVSVLSSARPGIVTQVATNATGQVTDLLLPGKYAVVLNASGSNLVVPFSIQAGMITSVDVFVTSTIYPVTFYDFLDQDSAGQIGNWQSFYAQVSSQSQIGSVLSTVEVDTLVNSTVYQVQFTTGATNGSTTFQDITVAVPQLSSSSTTAVILSENVEGGSVLMQLRPTSFITSDSVVGMDIVQSVANYRVNVGDNAT
jgi:hypothetical protein